MTREAIYTPTTGTNKLKETYEVGQILTVLWGEREYLCRVAAFPRNCANDTDHRMLLLPVNASFLGTMTISMENNYYGNVHISEVKIFS